ncbi:MAG: hypothetical protein N3F04_01200 [Candidatus Nezhaarchaeota archaeon]|nr:hypothetical protein [Candidatus Nezhaarchaeota archaeon]MCX8141394.1 hypothetical protein [Candidatus Nezhaarchaeota archaeon]MDW8049660.1 hypothetical protein [Nitrososphaerota archaeon]
MSKPKARRKVKLSVAQIVSIFLLVMLVISTIAFLIIVLLS